MKRSYKIATIKGIPIRVHISLFLLMGYILLQGVLRGMQNGGVGAALVWGTLAIALQVLVFASIVLHELGHSFVAIMKGCGVRDITLMFVGGAAVMERIPRKPMDEIIMAAAGPAVSMALALFFFTLAASFAQASHWLFQWLHVLLTMAGSINFYLACFNLLPAFPMDGGRILRALLTRWFGRLKATRLAMHTGQALAGAFVFVAIFGLPGFVPPLSPVLALIAYFIFINARREYEMIQLESLMEARGFTPPPEDTEKSASRSQADGPVLPDDHTVLISPPPYDNGPFQKAHLEEQPHSRFGHQWP